MKFIFKAFVTFLVLIFLAGTILFFSGYGYVAPIMMYHHVDDSNYGEANYVSLEKFEEHLKFLKDHHYHVISFHELVTLIKENRRISRKTVVLTFDDGYRNNYLNAYKLLKKYGFPAMIFVPTGSIGEPDRLTEAQMKEMMANGIAIGSHTQTECYLPDKNLEELYEELSDSRKILEKILGKEVRYLAYPCGGFTKEAKEVARKSGYLGACTTNRGYDRWNKDVFELNRIRFSNKDNSNVILWVKLSGYYNLFRKPKNPY